MDNNKSLDKLVKLIAAVLLDAHASYGTVFNTRALRLTTNVVERRVRMEGIGFLTKTLPTLGKHLDQVLSGGIKMNPASIGFAAIRGTKLPRFLGEFFTMIFSPEGDILPNPDATCVAVIRRITYLFYKYEIAYSEEQEHDVIQAFKNAEDDIATTAVKIAEMQSAADRYSGTRRISKGQWESFRRANPLPTEISSCAVIREARILLSRLFAKFDPTDIVPRHGPGAVATKQRLWEKFRFTNISGRITQRYPADAYFYASLGHVCDRQAEFNSVTDTSLPARVLLVPKDSRGPRLISCEPVDFQWIQQGLHRAIVDLVEKHPLTRFNVFFTDQGPNRRGALLGSSTKRYATLDLKEASDRVSLGLVRLLFPSTLCEYLESCRSSSTVLPSGEELQLGKFAPMGSALCFPIMALTIWAILTAVSPNASTRESVLVYGDDVIVPTDFSVSAITWLEHYGLKINRNKSCVQGFFRESCGMDAFKGIDVTPVRLRTVWNESPRPDVYTSWISYANSFYDRRCYNTYDLIVGWLSRVYGPIPGEDMNLSCPTLRVALAGEKHFKRRWNKDLQKVQFKVRVETSPKVTKVIDGWLMLLRYFTESQRPPPSIPPFNTRDSSLRLSDEEPVFSVSSYTKRKSTKLVFRWCSPQGVPRRRADLARLR
jgi:hypothetical protein